jgi:hypothetical protein
MITPTSEGTDSRNELGELQSGVVNATPLLTAAAVGWFVAILVGGAFSLAFNVLTSLGTVGLHQILERVRNKVSLRFSFLSLQLFRSACLALRS